MTTLTGGDSVTGLSVTADPEVGSAKYTEFLNMNLSKSSLICPSCVLALVVSYEATENSVPSMVVSYYGDETDNVQDEFASDGSWNVHVSASASSGTSSSGSSGPGSSANSGSPLMFSAASSSYVDWVLATGVLSSVSMFSDAACTQTADVVVSIPSGWGMLSSTDGHVSFNMANCTEPVQEGYDFSEGKTILS